MAGSFDESFPHAYKVRLLNAKPLILPPRYFVFPKLVDEIERDALLVEVLPAPAESRISESRVAESWTGAFALGFAAPSVVTGIFSCPNPRSVCVVAGGYAYLVDTSEPTVFVHLRPRPVVRALPVPEAGLLLFCDFSAITAIGRDGVAWETPPLTWEGLSLGKIESGLLHGMGWDAIADREVPFTVELASGRCEGGARPFAKALS